MEIEKPLNPNFSSGPCRKNHDWEISTSLRNALVGRSHRSKIGKIRIKNVIELTKRVLEIPKNYILAIVPGSDTGAIELAFWNFLGFRGVDVLAWDSFGYDWVDDIVNQLKISDVRVFKSEYGQLPDLKQVSFSRDVVFTWNGTTSGVCIPNSDWIKKEREGLTICDATSAVFAMPIDWQSLDITTFSWQKSLGGEAAHGVLILSPRAINRLKEYKPDWPVPKLFNLFKNKKINFELFEGLTINTPSMLAIEDWHNALIWAKNMGGLNKLQIIAQKNLNVIKTFCEENEWINFLASEPSIISCTSVCLKFDDKWYNILSEIEQRKIVKDLCIYLEENEVAYDIEGYRSAPPGIRIWCGPTIPTSDIKKLMPWIFKAWEYVKKNNLKISK